MMFGSNRLIVMPTKHLLMPRNPLCDTLTQSALFATPLGLVFNQVLAPLKKHQILRMLAAKVAMAHRANMSKNRMTKCGISS